MNIRNTIKKIPKSPGVYKFYDTHNKLIYIGKATFLRDRVRSYFARRSLGEGGYKTKSLVSQIRKIKYQKTDTVLEALILESNLIKKFQPKYNSKAKDDKSFSYFLITKNENFPRVLLIRETDLKKFNKNWVYGPYTSRRKMEVALKIIRRIFPFHSMKLKTEKGCLDFQLGRCSGPYAGAISKKDYLRNIRGIEMILAGKKPRLIKKLKKEMQAYAQKHEYEKAANLRNKIFALQHIQDVALISETSGQWVVDSGQSIRIEAYDISNIGGNYAVGSMVVFSNNKPDKSQYRRFKIKTVEGVNDTGMMREILERRVKRRLTTSYTNVKVVDKNLWPDPDLIILDGGKAHLNMAEKLLRDADLDIPVAAIAKGPTRKKLDLYYTKNAVRFFNILSNVQLIEKIRSEAHRFAISYHRKLRRKNWMN
ncbi:MAG: hypothetical protein FJZ04_02330 [Candidatus Moranbacteria bacterium]|nr:hypothetical protein [Candidatus Moranbacteria bacterium]